MVKNFFGKIKDKHIFIFYLLLFFGIAAIIALHQPHMDTPPLYGNPPDEPNRYLVSRFICRYGRLPNGYDPEIRIPVYGISYGFYTMLPYMVQGFVMRFVNLFTDSELLLLYTARFVNVCTGTAMAAVVYGIGGRLFSDRRFKWLFSLLVTFLPQCLFIHTYVNTDSMALFSAALIVYAWVRAYQEGFTVKTSLILAVGIIICSLSYYNAYGYILSSIILFIAFYLKKENGRLCYDWRMFLMRGALISGVVLLGIGWYFIRNAILYQGDLLGLDSLRTSAALYGNAELIPYNHSYAARGLSLQTMLQEHQFFKGIFFSFVAAFGSMTVWGGRSLYLFYALLFLLGWMAFFVVPGEGGMTELNLRQKLILHINMIFCILIPILLCTYYAYSMDYQYQGRYVMPGVIPFMYFITAGLKKLAGLKWLPDKWEKTKKVLSIIANVAVYAAMAAIIILLFRMVFSHALPVYLQSEGVL
ncbi:MAG: DUF2142 domain-containing protein [Lachnospiraceae bacterium]|nr:DUF2142 domain-containing protein [Lachnospiraceae bacterium]